MAWSEDTVTSILQHVLEWTNDQVDNYVMIIYRDELTGEARRHAERVVAQYPWSNNPSQVRRLAEIVCPLDKEEAFNRFKIRYEPSR